MGNKSQVLIDFFENSENCYYVKTDLEGNYTYVNPFFQQRFGFIADNFLGKPFGITVWHEDAEKCNQAAYQCMTNPSSRISIEIRKPELNETFFWTCWEFSALTNEQGEPVELQCLGYDISEREHAKEEVAYQSKLLKSIYDSTNNITFFLGLDFKVLLFNKKAAEYIMMLHNKSMQIGDNFLDYVSQTTSHKHESVREVFIQNFNYVLKGIKLESEQHIIYPDGRSLWYNIQMSSVNVKGKPVGVSLDMIDITERKNTESFVKTKNEALTEIGESVSHDIRGPVASILGLIMLFDEQEMSDENRELLKLLESSANTLDRVTKIVVNKAYLTEIIGKTLGKKS